MPFALLAIGLVLVIAAYNNTQSILSGQLQKDFSGKTGFIYWIAAIIIVGAIGYIDAVKNTSRAMLGLILVVLFLTNKGMFAQFNAALSGSTGDSAPATTGDAKTTSGTPSVTDYLKQSYGYDGATGMSAAPGETGPLVVDVYKRPEGVTMQ